MRDGQAGMRIHRGEMGDNLAIRVSYDIAPLRAFATASAWKSKRSTATF